MKCPFPTCTLFAAALNSAPAVVSEKNLRSAAWPPFTLIPRRERGLGSRPPPTLTEVATVTREKPGRLSWGASATQKLSSSALAFGGPAEAGSSPSVGWSGVGGARLEVHPALGWGAAQESGCG